MSDQQPPPKPNGDQLWRWDGQQWQPAPRPRIGWRYALLFTAGGLVLGFCTGAVAGASARPTPTASPQAQAAVATVAPTPTRTPAATPTPVPAIPAPGPQVMMQQQGSGISSTGEFDAPSHWKLSYSYDCSNFGQSGNFIVSLHRGSAPIGVLANELGRGDSKTTDVYQGGQRLHLSINSVCSWSVKAATA